jgi:hypothetical protein
MWIIPSNHPLYSAFAPAVVCSKEDLNELSDLLPSRLMWRSKPFAYTTWLLRWNRVWWVQHLFGRTLKPSHHQLFTEKYTASLADIPASLLASPGKGGGANDPRHLWPYLRRHIAAIRPVWAWFENVRGHLSMGLETVYRELSEMDYAIEIGIYSAAERGATHERQRVFILAMDNTHRERFRQKPTEMLPERYGTLYKKGKRTNFYSEIGRSGNVLRWPAAPGQPQELWEENRTVKPGLGCTIDGYNFTKDILRMLGNGVVEQTAELAFIDLLNKHLK